MLCWTFRHIVSETLENHDPGPSSYIIIQYNNYTPQSATGAEAQNPALEWSYPKPYTLKPKPKPNLRILLKKGVDLPCSDL